MNLHIRASILALNAKMRRGEATPTGRRRRLARRAKSRDEYLLFTHHNTRVHGYQLVNLFILQFNCQLIDMPCPQ